MLNMETEKSQYYEADDMKFKDIKKGDTVYIQAEVRPYGWGRTTRFWVPVTVDKVTPKQFVVGNKRYKKENGHCLGGNYMESAAMLGDDDFGHKVTNQLAEKNALVHKMNTAYNVNSMIAQFKIDHKHPKLTEIHDLIKKAEALLVNV